MQDGMRAGVAMVAEGATGEGVATDETERLAFVKVEGTPVYSGRGQHLGSVHNVIIDKVSGQVRYAVMSLSGFPGRGECYHPLPWKALTSDTRQGAFRRVRQIRRANSTLAAETRAELARGGLSVRNGVAAQIGVAMQPPPSGRGPVRDALPRGHAADGGGAASGC